MKLRASAICLVCGLGCVVLGWLLKVWIFMPFSWIGFFAMLGLALGFFAAALRPAVLKFACLMLMSLLLALAGLEGLLAAKKWSGPDLRQIGNAYPEAVPSGAAPYKDNWEQHAVLGFGPAPRASVTRSVEIYRPARKHPDVTVVYDVIYSTLDSGWRITPQHPQVRTAVVFFGCSFTFGEGLNDAESFPYQVGELLGANYQVFNFGFSGYGSHQMLAFLEDGGLDGIAAAYDRVLVFYTTIVGHEQRCTGVNAWTVGTPRYVLENGRVQRQGNWADVPELFSFLPLRKSLALGRLMETVKAAQWGHENMISHHAAIIKASCDYIKEKYASDMQVVLWPPVEKTLAPLLQKEDLSVLPLGDFLPALVMEKQNHSISIHDDHPNVVATRKVARLLADTIRKGQMDQ